MQISEWEAYIQEGRQYFKTARNGRNRRQVFTNELTYNLIGLSVEKLLIGLCMYQGHVPDDHTIGGIVSAVHDLFPMDPQLMKGLLMMEKIQDMCSLEVNNLCIVSDQQIDHLLILNQGVVDFVDTNLEQPAPADAAG